MNPATRARLVDLLWSGRCPAGAVVPDMVLHGEADFPAWALEILLLTEEYDDGLEHTEVIYRACGSCLSPIGMQALVYGHACQGTPDLPRWAQGVLGAVL